MTTIAQANRPTQHAVSARFAPAAAVLKGVARDLAGVFRFWMEVCRDVAELRREVNRASHSRRFVRTGD